MRLALVTALALGWAPPLTGQTTGTVLGRITGSATGDTIALPHAVVEILAPVRRTATADTRGAYELLGVPSGAVRVRVLYAGLEDLELEVLVPSADTLHLDLHLEGSPVELGRIDVSGEAASISTTDVDERLPRGVAELETEAMTTTTGLAESGLVAAARRRSGNDPADPTRLLFMRGSTADLKLILLDGAPIHTPFHLGGLLDPIEAGTVGRAHLYLGGAPARYNGGISHILDIETRRPASTRGRGVVSADLMGLSALVEKRAAPGGILASGRTLHGGANSLYATGPEPYGYYDGMVRADLDVGPGSLSVTAFTNSETVDLDPVLGLADASQVPTGLLHSADETDAAWSNTAVSTRYRASVGPWSVAGTAAWSDYTAQLPVGDTALAILGGTSRKTHVAFDVVRQARWGSTHAGLSYDDVTVEERAEELLSGTDPGPEAGSIGGRVVGGYVEAVRTFAGGVTVRGGLRADAFRSTQTPVEWSPRASLLWPVSERALFRLAVGRFSQFARRSDPAVESDIGIRATEFQGEALLAVATATHLVASLDQELTPRVTVGLEGFVKSYHGLPDTGGESVNASGMDLRLARVTGPVEGWFGYTLTWFWSGNGTDALSSQFSGHHLLTAGLSGPLFQRLDGAVRLSYGSGLPFTSIPLGDAATEGALGTSDGPGAPDRGSPPIPLPDESFLRVDVTLSGTWTVGQRGTRSVQLSPYVKVLNALDRRDALFHYFEPWRPDSTRPLAELPLLPLVGLRLSF